ncbi:chemotaxis protein CheW [Marivirga lumbricoides]|uniref:Chemotaxis protein CheW n=1 Tax=Marivirga lumbricoides TaxID=1046115 RepID=A0A2T4DU46_9BACT|nr:chemotaxis protein CheW [Marivirga lumbricoides]
MNSSEKKIGHFIILHLGKDQFAINVMKVKEILELSKITEVPESPHYLRGIVNLRGSLLSVVDLRAKFGLEVVEDTPKTRIVVLDIESKQEHFTVGVIVDQVTDVIEFDEAQIQIPTDMEDYKKAAYIKGMMHIQEDFIMLIDIDKVFSSSEASLFGENTLPEDVAEE